MLNQIRCSDRFKAKLSEGLPGYPREAFLADLINEAATDIRGALEAGADSVQIDFTKARLSLKLDPSGGLPRSLFMDLAARTSSLRGMGIQEWLSFYFKDPGSAPGVYPEHDLFIQHMKLKNTLRHIMGEGLITHLGLDYYGE